MNKFLRKTLWNIVLFYFGGVLLMYLFLVFVEKMNPQTSVYAAFFWVVYVGEIITSFLKK